MTKEPMTKMPKEARSIARIIRKAVKRPSEKRFVWNEKRGDWRTRKGTMCPMGMHPLAKCEAPSDVSEFPPSKSALAVSEFIGWGNL